MDAVAEFVEQGDYALVFEKARFRVGRLCEVADQGRGGAGACTVLAEEGLQDVSSLESGLDDAKMVYVLAGYRSSTPRLSYPLVGKHRYRGIQGMPRPPLRRPRP